MMFSPGMSIRRTILALATLLIIVLLLGLFASNASAESGVTRSYEMLPEDELSPYESDEADDADTGMLFGCKYKTRGDHPHRSGGDVSAHGWWTTTTPKKCPRYAYVEVWLKAWACDYQNGRKVRCFWDTVDHDEKRIRAGGGRGKRTNVRKACASNKTVSYMSIIDVDLEGMWDGPGRTKIQKNVPCSPAQDSQ